ncbi:MAG: hypothetical protein QOF48_1535 [Verrucomicrobiota bacterium]|jgi:Na+/H+ antiporter NhaD/arsenite permease-like protein
MGDESYLFMVLPFAALLGLIALGPLWFPEWWGKHYPKVCLVLGAATVLYYLLFLPGAAAQKTLQTGEDYVGFIALIGSLFVVSGGIQITVKGEATPLQNVGFLMTGAVLANLLGTTGASMLLIRPWLRMNRRRVSGHHVAFFIFIVSNIGGCLTPIGDPPLFLGYLKGVPFWWVARHCWPMWATGLSILLAIFYVLDRLNYSRVPAAIRQADFEPPDTFRFRGLGNLVFLAIIIAAVLFVEKPRFLRESILIAAAAGSYFTTRKSIHEANQFEWHPLKEVAILFAGIFATMMPALDWLRQHAGGHGTAGPAAFYWGSGLLSSVLDNAPTYLGFLKGLVGMMVDGDAVKTLQNWIQNHGIESLDPVPESIRVGLEALRSHHGEALLTGRGGVERIEVAFILGNPDLKRYLVAISVGSVFFGANTYIGNGPNFMVKSIADRQKVRTPTFLGYMFKFALPFMAPMLIIVWWLFFRG